VEKYASVKDAYNSRKAAEAQSFRKEDISFRLGHKFKIALRNEYSLVRQLADCFKSSQSYRLTFKRDNSMFSAVKNSGDFVVFC